MQTLTATVVGDGPDEKVCRAQADTLRAHGARRGLRILAREYLSEPMLAAYPSPARWLWIWLLAATRPLDRRAMQFASVPLCALALAWCVGSWVAVPLALSSPLLLAMARRELQEAPVAALTLLAAGCAINGHPVALCLALAVLLCMKEAAALSIGPLIVAGAVAHMTDLYYGPQLVLASAVALLAWAASLERALGRRWLDVLVRCRAHATPYTREHQRGGAHRLLVDLAILSPVVALATVAAVEASPALVLLGLMLVGAYGVSPVNNVRTILAADLALRGAVASFALARGPLCGCLMIAALVLADLAVWRRVRNVYDPVTIALARSIGAVP